MSTPEPVGPAVIGRYRVLARLGAGGMGVVYLGRSPAGRPVAIKVLHPELAAEPGFRDRFRAEVAAAGLVGGGFGAPVLDADPDADPPWLVTEFLPAVSLREAVRRFGPLPPGSVWPLAAGIVAALRAIHRAGLVHLDLKPSNVLLTADGPRVIDFGIAHALDAGSTARAGGPAGSPGFMSPEQEAGATIGPLSDVYSLGATLAYASTGSGPPGPPRVADVADPALRALIADCVRPDPADRPTVSDLDGRLAVALSAGVGWLPAELATEIDRRAAEPLGVPPAAPRPPFRPSRRTLLLGGLGAVALAGGIGVPAVAAWTNVSHGPAPGTTHIPGGPSGSPSPSARPRTLEIYLSGSTGYATFTLTLDGRPTTVTGPKLPYRTQLAVAPLPHTITWTAAWHFTAGSFTFELLMNGFRFASGGGSSNADPVDDHTDGKI